VGGAASRARGGGASFSAVRGARHVALLLGGAGLALLAGAGLVGSATPPDPLRADLERWAALLATTQSDDPLWKDIQASSGPELERARLALEANRRLLALQRLGSARGYLEAWSYLSSLTAAQRKDEAVLESEWKRVGKELAADLAPVRAEDFANLRPAALRGMAEAAAMQLRAYYEASLLYGRADGPESGLIYLGLARAQRDLVALYRTASSAAGGSRSVPALVPRIDDLQGEVLAAYRPPASLEKHSDFIGVSSALKEARELETAGLRDGALLRYLQAAQRFAMLRLGSAPAPADERSGLARRLGEETARPARGGDDSYRQLFLEAAAADLASPASGERPLRAAAVLDDVLPRYAAALQPASAPAPVKAALAVTLVRWPYT
jgi:hypothetical protein